MINNNIYSPMTLKVILPSLMQILLTPVTLFVLLWQSIPWDKIPEGGLSLIPLAAVTLYVILKYREDWISKRIANKKSREELIQLKLQTQRERNGILTFQEISDLSKTIGEHFKIDVDKLEGVIRDLDNYNSMFIGNVVEEEFLVNNFEVREIVQKWKEKNEII